MPVDECLHKFGFSNIYIYICCIFKYIIGILYLYIFIQIDPQKISMDE